MPAENYVLQSQQEKQSPLEPPPPPHLVYSTNVQHSHLWIQLKYEIM
jgi:hypothetical protein